MTAELLNIQAFWEVTSRRVVTLYFVTTGSSFNTCRRMTEFYRTDGVSGR